MIKVITRLCADTKAAKAVKERLRNARLPGRDLHVFDASGGESAKTLAARLTDLGVASDTAATYAERMGQGNAVIMARATYKPLGAPRITREVMAASDTIDMGDLVEETEVKEAPKTAGEFKSVLEDHPLFLTQPLSDGPPRRRVSESFGMRLLSHRRPPSNAVISGTRHFTSFIPLLIGKRRRDSAIPGGRLMTDFMPMLREHRQSKSVIRGGPVFSRALNLPTIIRR